MTSTLKYTRIFFQNSRINRILNSSIQHKQCNASLGRIQGMCFSRSSSAYRYKDTGPCRPISSFVTQRADVYDQKSIPEEGDVCYKVKRICMLEEDRMVEATWADGKKSRYPYVWLRDNCQCTKCFHEFTHARLLLMRNLDVNIRPQSLVASSFFSIQKRDMLL